MQDAGHIHPNMQRTEKHVQTIKVARLLAASKDSPRFKTKWHQAKVGQAVLTKAGAAEKETKAGPQAPGMSSR